MRYSVYNKYTGFPKGFLGTYIRVLNDASGVFYDT